MVDILAWMKQHHLQFSLAKTELLVFPASPTLQHDFTIQLGSSSITPSRSIRNLGVLFDDQLTFKDHIAKTARSCRFALHNIRKIRPFLTEYATQLLVQALVIFRLDYCNALLAGLPLCAIKPLQMIQNAAARRAQKGPRHTFLHLSALATTRCLHQVQGIDACLQIDHRLPEAYDRSDTLTYKDLVAGMAQHEVAYQRHEAVPTHQVELMAKHSDLHADVMKSIGQLFQWIPESSPPPAPRPPPIDGPQPSSFPTDRSKIAYIITLLADKALSWASAVWQSQDVCCGTYALFVEEFKRVFDHPVSGRESSRQLLTLKQGSCSTADFAIEFRTIASGSGWNDEALMACFQGGLSGPILEPATDLETFITMAICLDNRLRERESTRRKTSLPRLSGNRQPYPVRISSPISEKLEPPEDMQLGCSRLSLAERDRHMRENRCLYCGASGHFRLFCPELPGNDRPRLVTGGL
ncbi:hypothetical protein PO909_033807 [Leuciscus waleckii]